MLASIAVAIFIFAASPNPFAANAVGVPFANWPTSARAVQAAPVADVKN